MTDDPYHRYPVSVDALIFGTGLQLPVSCTIRNVSAFGALLAVAQPVRLPKRVYLALRKGTQVLECEVRWRNFNRLFGVRFSPNTDQGARKALVEFCAFTSQSEPHIRKRA